MASEDEDEDLEALKLAALVSMKKKSDVKKVSDDDIEDPELIALREAALLTKKNNANQNNLVNNQFQDVPPLPLAPYTVTDQYCYPVYEQPVYSFSYPPPPPNYPPPMLYHPPPPMLAPHNQIQPDMLLHQSIPGSAFHVSDSHPDSSVPMHQMPITTQGMDVEGKGGSPFMEAKGRNSPFTQGQGRNVGNNLIVITQAAGEDAADKGKSVNSETDAKPQLYRPQDKWLGPSDGNSSTASPARRPKTSDKFSRFDSSDNSSEESESDDDDVSNKKNESISGDDGNDSNKENGSSDSPSNLSSYESDNEKNHTLSLNITKQKDIIINSNSKENTHSYGSEIRQDKEITLRNDKQKHDASSHLDGSKFVKKLSTNHQRDSHKKTNDLNPTSYSSRDKVSDLSEKLRNRKAKQEKDLSEKLLNRKAKIENDLSEKLLNRRFRNKKDLSEKLINRKDGKKDIQDLSEKLTSRKSKSASDVNKDTSVAEQLSKDSLQLETEKQTTTSSDIQKTSSNNGFKLGMTEEERQKLEARRQKFQHQKSLDSTQVQKTISLKSIKKRKRKKLKSTRSRSRSLPKQYRNPPRSPSLPRQYRDIRLPRSKSPHHSTRERSRSLSLPRQYRTEMRDRNNFHDRSDLRDRTGVRDRLEIHSRLDLHDRGDLRDRHKPKERKGHDRNKIESSYSGHKNDEKHRTEKVSDRRRSSGDKGKSVRVVADTNTEGRSKTKNDTDEESEESNASISDVESEDSEGRSWRNEANKNRIRRKSGRNVRQIPNSLNISHPFGERQRSNYNNSYPDRFRDRRKRRDHFDRERFERKQRYDNFTIKRAKHVDSEEEDDKDKRVSSSVVLPTRNITSLPTTDDAVESDSSKKSTKKRTPLQQNVLEVTTAKRRVINNEIVRKARRVTADFDSEFDARNYMNRRSKAIDEDVDDKSVNDSEDDGDSMGVFVTLAADDKDDLLPRTSVHNRLGKVLDSSRSENPYVRSLLKPVLRNTEERCVKRVKSKSKDDGLYEDDLEIKIKQIKEKNAAILRRQEEIRKDKERFGYK